MKRRDFLYGATAAAYCCPRAIEARAPEVSADLTLHNDPSAPLVPRNFTGLSYELAQLTDPSFFSAHNRELVAYFRLLSNNGILRLGGNTSEFCWFKASASTVAPKLHIRPATSTPTGCRTSCFKSTAKPSMPSPDFCTPPLGD